VSDPLVATAATALLGALAVLGSIVAFAEVRARRTQMHVRANEPTDGLATPAAEDPLEPVTRTFPTLALLALADLGAIRVLGVDLVSEDAMRGFILGYAGCLALFVVGLVMADSSRPSGRASEVVSRGALLTPVSTTLTSVLVISIGLTAASGATVVAAAQWLPPGPVRATIAVPTPSNPPSTATSGPSTAAPTPSPTASPSPTPTPTPKH